MMALAAVNTHATEPIRTATSLSSLQAEKQYQQALKDARAGHLEPAILVLGQLVERFPQRQDILRDYAVVLGWAGKYDEALALYESIDIPTSPAYVIEGLASSARHQQRYELAESLYWQSITRFAERTEPQIGLAYTLADEGKLVDAWRVIQHLREKYPRHIDVLETYAYVATVRHDDFAALEAYESILAQQPDHRGALRGKTQTLARLGAPQLALEFADAHAGIISVTERDALAADRTAHKIRWAAITADTGVGEARFAALDLALAESDLAGARALDPNIELSPTERQLALDRISALSQRYRMKDAITLYEAMAKRAQEIPAYAKAAAASAYLYLEQPESARDLYREALETDPSNLNTRIGLFYALAECEEHAAALKEVDGVVAMTPIVIDAWSPVTIRENPAYARAQSARAMAPMYANQPGKAEQRLHLLADSAPFNMDVRTDYASAMRARGWPRHAEQELSWVLAAEPNNSGALGEHAGALLEMRDYRDAESALVLAQSVDAEDGRVVRAGRLATVHQMRELVVEGEFGRSSGDSNGGVSPRGTQDYELDAKLYSSPFDYNYRVFGHLFSAQAKFDTGTGRRERAGVGLEYRSPLVTATGELSQGIDDSKTAGAVTLALTPIDYWSFVGGYETSSNQTPLQATLAGIDAKRASVGAIWRANESRSAALGFENMDFSDGNQRNATSARWTERVIAGPVYKLEITAGLYTSNNSQDNRPYFNPSRDFSPTLEFANEWLQWRRYTRAFRHRLVATVGDYQQQSFGTSPLYNLRYEQEWDADDRLTVRYGIGHSQQPYDGVQTSRNYGYFYLDWWF
ncbi:MAG TPA: poly-beta-1,6 N-acetyl-D-glucosamine export porin PgaA [Methyloradius sp.]